LVARAKRASTGPLRYRPVVSNRTITFGHYEFDCQGETLWRNREIVPLGSRGAALLRALLEADGAIVHKDALMQAAWPNSIVEDANLPVQIRALRQILGQRGDGSDWITTSARAGYRLVRDATPVGGLPAIAVLPFAAMDETSSFADGFVEDLIMALSRFKTFRVASRRSSEAFRDKHVSAQEIARTLGARYLIEGSIRRTGAHIRLGAQLIDGETGLHLWSEKVDGTLEGIFDLQDRLVAGVVGMFEPHLRRAEIDRAARKRPESLDAYDLYLRALPLIRGVRDFQLEHFEEAIVLLEQAIALDPNFAPALALCSAAHELRLTNGGVAPPGVDDARIALDLIERALQADNSDAMVLVSAGAVQLVLANNEARAFALLRQAEALNPNSLLIISIAAYCYWHVGQYDEAIERRLRGLALAPDTPEAVWLMGGVAMAHLSAGRMEEALQWGLRALDKTELLDLPHCIVAAAYAHLERQAEAEAHVKRIRTRWPDLTIHRLTGAKTAPRVRFQYLEQGLLLAGLPAE
jgi:TolB-like protein/tetratricopeptide (TPR) repeat protein